MPDLPLAKWWSVLLDGAVSAGPVSGGSRIYLALASAHLTARDAADGKEIWRHERNVTTAMVADGDLLFVASGDAVEALHGDTGKTAWTLARMTPVAPLLASSGWLIVTTDTQVIAVKAATGEVVWQRAAGGVKLAPALDGDRLYTGAGDGRVLALSMKDGSVQWQQFIPEGVTAIAARGGRIYVGGGDKLLHCLEAKKGDDKWAYMLGAQALGHVAVDEERVYVAALNNVVKALDRQSGNQHWLQSLKQRPTAGVYVAGHVVFAPNVSQDLTMLYARDGRESGSLNLPGDGAPGLTPSITESKEGTVVYAVTGGLTNEWHLTKYARAGEAGLIPLAKLDAMPGVPYLIDPVLTPIGNVMGTLLLGDPRLMPFCEVGWPIVLRDPPLAPLTTLPGVQLRPLSPTLPVRRGERGPGG